MNKRFLLYVAPLLLTAIPASPQMMRMPMEAVSYEQKNVAKIQIIVETLQPGSTFNPESVKAALRTKEGDVFSQSVFDQDLKQLSQQYYRIDPQIEVMDGELYITIKLWQKPIIRAIRFEGNKKFSTRKLQKELDIAIGTRFDRDEFNKAFNKLKELYVKRGYFEAQLNYQVIPDPKNNEVVLEIDIDEGRSGHVKQMRFNGFSKEEESAILKMINTKKYNLFTSWLTGFGIYNEEAVEHDKLIITNYLQDEGYADAKVSIATEESADGQIVLNITAERGEKYYFNQVTFSGNTLFSDEEIQEALLVKEGKPYSPEKLRETIESLKELYGKKGYIDANIQYELQLVQNKPEYNVSFKIEEGEQYRVGVIQVLGNVQTETHVILRESLLVPGEVFDTRMLKATQSRLQAIGYFKSVNVYAIRTPEDKALGPNFRDVIIEVEETTTGNVSLFFGFSTVDSIFGGLDLAESNFNHKGLTNFWRKGFSSLRGGGEYAHARVTLGAKQSSYAISWMDPYFRDTYWRVGFDANYSHSKVTSDDYSINTMGFSIFGSYPINPFFSYGLKYRFRNSIIHIDKDGAEALNEERNSGIVTGVSFNLAYDSTDNIFKPHRGFRSIFETELAGVRRHSSKERTFPMARFSYINSYYYPVWRKGTLKFRGDFRFLVPFGGNGKVRNVPISERFFLGGETTVRGYAPYSLGPKLLKEQKDKEGNTKIVESNDPTGGLSSVLLSLEYNQQLFRLMDLFIFFDGGSIALERFHVHRFQMSYGLGVRLELGNRLPFTVGYGIPINPTSNDEVRRFFFSMGGQF
ncbi:MAG: outer membrane protein assembly factor BamA [Simkaniaceae bacterium]